MDRLYNILLKTILHISAPQCTAPRCTVVYCLCMSVIYSSYHPVIIYTCEHAHTHTHTQAKRADVNCIIQGEPAKFWGPTRLHQRSHRGTLCRRLWWCVQDCLSKLVLAFPLYYVIGFLFIYVSFTLQLHDTSRESRLWWVSLAMALSWLCLWWQCFHNGTYLWRPLRSMFTLLWPNVTLNKQLLEPGLC